MRERRSTSSSRKFPSTAVGSIPRARSLFSTSARFSRTKFKSSISNYFTGPSILPAHVGIGRGRFPDAIHDLGQIHGVVVQPREGVGQVRVAIPAVFRAVAILHFALVRDAVARSAGLVEKVLHQVDRVVEKVGVRGADVEMKLALEQRPP